MPPTPNRDLSEVVSELVIKMPEVRSELNTLNGRIDRQGQAVEKGFQELRQEFCGETRQSTERLTDAFPRSMTPLINRVLDYGTRLNRFENSQA